MNVTTAILFIVAYTAQIIISCIMLKDTFVNNNKQ